VAFRQKKTLLTKFDIFLCSVLLILGLAVFAPTIYGMNKRVAELREREKLLEEQIEQEHKRAAEIEEYRKYTKTRRYVEQTARSKLGLVYEDEIIFKDED